MGQDHKPKRQKNANRLGESEVLPDAWERFERAVDVVVRSGPSPKKARETIKDRPSKGKPPI
jgi:hypothetical protein